MRGCNTHFHETLDLTDSVDTKLIDPPKNSLRSYRDGIEELVSSIREKGLIQPIIVRPLGQRFEVVAGARRLEACKRLHWSRVPSIIRELTDQNAYEISLTENIQRKTMNPIEEAEAFKKYVDHYGWGGESQLATKIGKSQEYVSQRMSLLSLPRSVRSKIIRRLINPSVASEIARLHDPQIQEELSDQVVSNHLSVGVVREAARSIKAEEEQVLSAIGEKKKQESVSKSSVLDLKDASEPEFIRGLGKNDLFPGEENAIRDLDKAGLILRLALSRFGLLIDEIPDDSPIKDVLLEQRLTIHNMIDALIKSKIKIGGNGRIPIPMKLRART
jgi:ParB family chromosome partitioning protein